MKKILLTKGKYAIVDDEDYPFLNRMSWYAKKTPKTVNGIETYRAVLRVYESLPAQTKKDRNKITIYMEQFLIKIENCHKIGHRNRNTLDNRKSNLVATTQGKSLQHAKKRILTLGKKPTSKYKGVTLQKNRYGQITGYYSHINKDKKRYYLGVYKTEEEAGVAYNKKAIELYGDYAFLNEIRP